MGAWSSLIEILNPDSFAPQLQLYIPGGAVIPEGKC